jgi:hypothetical protein
MVTVCDGMTQNMTQRVYWLGKQSAWRSLGELPYIAARPMSRLFFIGKLISTRRIATNLFSFFLILQFDYVIYLIKR